MSTKGIIVFEGRDQFLYLSSDGYPSFVVPQLKQAMKELERDDVGFIIGNFAEEVEDQIEGYFQLSAEEQGYKYTPVSKFYPISEVEQWSTNHSYMVLKDGRVVVDSIKIVDLKPEKVTA